MPVYLRPTRSSHSAAQPVLFVALEYRLYQGTAGQCIRLLETLATHDGVYASMDVGGTIQGPFCRFRHPLYSRRVP
jgi:hypothetical protein